MSEQFFKFGWYVEKEPSLNHPSYSVLMPPLSDFYGHINNHGKGNYYSWDPEYLERSCLFCRIWKKHGEI